MAAQSLRRDVAQRHRAVGGHSSRIPACHKLALLVVMGLASAAAVHSTVVRQQRVWRQRGIEQTPCHLGTCVSCSRERACTPPHHWWHRGLCPGLPRRQAPWLGESSWLARRYSLGAREMLIVVTKLLTLPVCPPKPAPRARQACEQFTQSQPAQAGTTGGGEVRAKM